MKVHVEMTALTTTRRADGPSGGRLSTLTIRNLGESENGNFEVEVSGPRVKVEQWLKRNGFDEGTYDVVEL